MTTPADRVTLLRAVLACACATTTVFVLVGSVPARTWLLFSLSVPTLGLDAVDGAVARRTGTSSPPGARLDMELDAGVLLILSLAASRIVGPWVVLIGSMRYLYAAASAVRPAWRRPMPRRQFRRIIAGLQGAALAVAIAPVVPVAAAIGILIAATALLALSFGTEILEHERDLRESSRQSSRTLEAPSGLPTGASRGVRGVISRVITVVAGVIVWSTLVAPDRLPVLSLASFLRIPVEVIVLAALVLVLPDRVRPIVAASAGFAVGLVTILKLLDIGFDAALDRRFNAVSDSDYLRPAVGVLRDSIGRPDTIATLLAIVVGAILIVALTTASTVRLARILATHPHRTARAVTVLAIGWIVCAAFGVQIVPGDPISSTTAASAVYDEVKDVRAAIRDQKVFAAELADDRYGNAPGGQLLTALRGMDVLIVFVESYGQVAVENSSMASGVDTVLDNATRELARAGFASRSAYLTSPTFGGLSWLAHSTLQSGLWVDNQQRYDELVSSDRLTLSDAFRRAGWRTVVDVPSNSGDWPQATSFYHDEQVYNASNVGYQGPSFSYATMPDQYTLAALNRLELSRPDRRPVMAEIDLVSSHTPWAPLPHMVPWSQVGDGSVFDAMPSEGQSPAYVWADADRVRAAYGQSIEYSLRALTSFITRYAADNLMLIVLGDHQPATIVSGDDADHDVPVTIIAHNRSVLRRIGGWSWSDGMQPGPDAPVWPMDAFRNRFLTAFGP